MKPLRIYLDTSDYARLYKSKPGDSIDQVLNFLEENIQRGTIEIGYSYWVVTELIQDGAEDYAEDRFERGSIIRRLCGSNAFPYLTDLVNGARFPNGGYWMPLDTVSSLSVSPMAASMRDKIKGDPRLNRSLRRKLATRSGLQEAFRQYADGSLLQQSEFPDIPFTPEFIEGNYLKRYLTGEISEQAVNRKIREWMSDPRIFFRMYYQYGRGKNPLTPIVDGAAETITADLEKFIRLQRDVEDLYSSARISYEKYKFQKLKFENNTGLNTSMISLAKPKKPVFPAPEIKLDEIFGLGKSAYINTYLKQATKQAFQFSPSDLVDLLHLRYIFECDLLRCDSKMAAIFRTCPHMPSSRIVAKLEDLPGRIAERLH
ncbi:hypothetical protein GCM10007908_30150 [Rhizobium albus]|nr:hypothetical protein GCM10007908_30150 [Rhizobium albus]